MKVAYIACVGINSEAGVARKIFHQLMAWSKCGVDAQAFIVTGDTGDTANHFLKSLPVTIIQHNNDKKSFFASLRIAIITIRRWNPDIVYHRYFHYNTLLCRLFDDYRGILEINTNDLSEYRLSMPRLKYLVHRVRRQWLFKRVRGFVAVTKEISRQLEAFDKPICVLANGIHIEDHQVLPAPQHQKPALSFLGFPGYAWHGVDKIVRLAETFKDWDFNIIGYTPQDFASGVPSNVRLPGYLTEEQYLKILLETDVAIGTLALHRIGMQEACPLKTREYLARGIPAIIAYEDTDFPNETPFLLRLPNEENAVISHIDEIRQFVEQWRGKRVNRKDIKHLDINYKAQQQKDFFQKILK